MRGGDEVGFSLDTPPMIRRLVLCLVLGALIGGGTAYLHLRQGFAEGGIANGPWNTGRGVGSEKAGLGTRAVVALRGLLALPDSEAIYYNAATDTDGEPLDGRCRYTVSGAKLPARWWSITAYDPGGYLIPHDGGGYSAGSATLADAEQAGWQVLVAPDNAGLEQLPWIGTGGLDRFELTLRAYHPDERLLRERGSVKLPVIRKLGCPG